MNIVIPMAGAGMRFQNVGYKLPKPAIPTTDRRTGEKVPMAILAIMDLPGVNRNGSNVICIDRAFNKNSDLEQAITKYYPDVRFVRTKALTQGQACTCLLAKDVIDNNEELLIASCDTGMVMNNDEFDALRNETDVLVFTHRHSPAVTKKPEAYGWIATNDKGRAVKISVKKPISNNPSEDHAVTGTFWFRSGKSFVQSAEKMIREDDRINGEFYVDEVIKHALSLDMDVRVFEIDRYIGWGTPEDYEEYEATLAYWQRFISGNEFHQLTDGKK